MDKWGKRGKNEFLTIFLFYLGDFTQMMPIAHMQNFIQIPQTIKTGFPNVFKLVKLTLPFHKYLSKIRYQKMLYSM